MNEQTQLVKTLVLGYGNPLRGDDALGSVVIARLNRSDAVFVQQLTPELAADIAAADRVIFIDAACDNEQGEVVSRQVLPAGCPSNAFIHQLSPEVLLGLAQRLYGRCPPALLFSVGAASFEFGAGLSEPVQAALPALLAQIRSALITSEESYEET